MKGSLASSILIAVSLWAFVSPGNGQGIAQFRASAESVSLDVVVTGPNRIFVPRLNVEDFELYEDGVRQDIQFFSSDEETPLTLVLLLDTSASIRSDQKSIKKAASNLVNTMRPRDQASVVVFNESIQRSTHFTRFREPLLEAIDSIFAEGWTALYDSVIHSLDKLRGIEGRKALLVFTDGADSRPASSGSRSTKDEAVEAGRVSEATIYTIGFVAEGRGVNEDFLEALSTAAGGRSFFPVDVEHLERSFSQIGEELHTRYRLAYTPSNRASDGTWRHIEIRIKGEPGLLVRTRTGYYAGKDPFR